MKVIYDISVLGLSQYSGDPRTKTGVSRVIEALASSLKTISDCDLVFSTIHQHNEQAIDVLAASLAYLTSHVELDEIPLLHSPVQREIEEKLKDIRALLSVQSQIHSHSDSGMDSYQAFFEQFYASSLHHNAQHSSLWVQNERLQEFDIFHSTYFSIPESINKHIACFLMVYDLIPVLYPQFFGLEKENSVVYHALKAIAPKRDYITCISHSTKNDVCNFIDIDPDRVFVTPLAASPEKFYVCSDKAVINQTLEKYAIRNEPYFLSVCTLEPRKNISHLIQSFGELIRQEKLDNVNLVLVGAKGWSYQKIFEELARQPLLQNRIFLTGRVEDSDLAAIYSGALAFVYPSLYEGFGLPPLEAMQCGVPVITSNSSSLPEVVGDAGIMVDADSVNDLCQSMLKVYADGALRDEMHKKSIAQARQFSWSSCAEATWNAYNQALG